MNQSDIRKSIVKAIKVISANSNQKIHDIENMIEAWNIALEDIPDELIGHGLKKALNSAMEFMPSAGKFRELCLISGDHESIEAEGHEAWSLIMKNLSIYQTVMFKNTLIAESIRQLGGWRKICGMYEKEEAFIKKDFLQVYKSLKKTNNKDYIPLLSGQYGFDEISDIKPIGYSNEDHLLIESDFNKALKVRHIENKTMKMLEG